MKFTKRLPLLSFIALLCLAALQSRADVTLTPAVGGSALSADATGGTFTALTGPVLSEGATGDFGTGTIVLNCPAGFEIDTNSTVTVVVTGTGTGDDVTLDSSTADVTSSNITIQITAPSDGTEASVLTWSGINVRPTAGTPLAADTITETGTATFTLTSTPASNYGALTEVAGAAATLVFTTQPGAVATAGTPFSPQPVLSIEDQFGNVTTGDNTTQITVTRTAGGSLLGTTNLTAANGVFTFADLAESLAGPMTLTFSSAPLSSVESTSLTVDAAPVAQLSVNTQPTSTATAGHQFAQQPVVWLLDAYGNLCVNDNSTQVTASRINGVGNLQGTTTMTAVAGIVTYTDLQHFSATTMNLQFSTGSISTSSAAVMVEPGPAARLAFTQQPALAQAGHVFAAQPIVRVTDDFGNFPTTLDSSFPVTVTLASGTGTLYGTTVADAGSSFGNGLATFRDLQINTPGTKQLTASAPGLTNGVTASFNVTSTSQPLALFGSYSIGRTITSLWVGNFRGASTARDAVAVNHDDQSLTLRMSKDDGTFDTAAVISLPAHPIAARAADLNGDGYDDLVVTYDDTNVVSVLLSSGSHGTNFAAPVEYVFSALPDPQATAMFVADLNGDGKQDIIVSTASDDSVNILFGTAVTAFTSPVTYVVGANPVWINVSDVDHDGFQDIVTANKDDGTISILYGSAGGSYGVSRTVALDGDPQPVRVTTPDINRNGRLALAVVNYASNTVSLLTQQSNGSFLLTSNYTVGTHPTDFFLRDLDGDGFSDLAVLNSDSGTIDILFNHGTGSYVSKSTIAAGVEPTALFGGKFASSQNINGLLVADAADDSIAVYMFDGPTAVGSSVTVNENGTGAITLRARNPLFSQTYNFTITQYPTNGTMSGIAPALTYTPNHDYIGADTLKFRADINGVTSSVAVVSISVLAVNHQPTFTISTNLLRVMQGTAFSLRNFITAHDAGALSESAQKIDYIVTNIDTNLFTTKPAITTTGTLSFKLAPLANGTNDVTIYAHDSGGTARGGTNLSAPQVLRIIALRHNHLPVVKAIPTVTMLEDASTTNITITVTDLDDPMQNISVTPISLNESIVPTANIQVTGPFDTNFSIAITPTPDANGLATIQLLVADSQDTTIATFHVNVIAIDDAPSFSLPKDELYALQDSGTVTISNFCTAISAGPANESSQVLTFAIGNTNRAAFVLPPAIDKNGTLKFRPAIGYAGTNYFSVYLKDSGTTAFGGVNVSDTNWFSIGITTNNFRHITGTYNGLFYESAAIDHSSSGFFTFSLNYTRVFSGRIMIEGSTLPIIGQFDTNGFAEITVQRRGKSALDLQMQADLTDGTDQVVGTASTDEFAADLLGDRQATTLPGSIVPGRYNVVFTGNGNGTNDLGGDGVGTVTVTSANRLTFTGTLPDRTAISQSIGVSKDGQWPLYIPLYAGTGSMIAWVTVTNDVQPIVSDIISVIKESNLRNPFPLGLTNQFSTLSSTNAPFILNKPVISTNGIVTFSGADLTNDVVVPFMMSTNNFFYLDTSSTKMRLGFDRTLGYINGTFVDPVTGLSTRIRGLVLPNANAARGYFYTPTAMGEFYLQGN
jgi:hypothetical protein